MKDQEKDKELSAVEPHFADDLSEKGTKAVVEFTATCISVMENEKRVRLNLLRYGKMNNRVIIK